MKPLLFFLVFGLSLSSFAQNETAIVSSIEKNTTTTLRQKQFLKKLTEELHLDTYQQKQIDIIFTEQSIKVSEFKAKQQALNLDPANATKALKMSLRKQIQVNNIRFFSKLENVLNKDQYHNWVMMYEVSEEKRVINNGEILFDDYICRL